MDAGFAERCEGVADALTRYGWVESPGFLPPELVAALRTECKEGWKAGAFRAANVSRARLRDPEIRSDAIAWIDGETPARREALEGLETLRLAVNRATYLGLFDVEAHLAVFPPGTFYARHLDRFRDQGSRVVSCVLYLNPGWKAEDGGELRLHLPEGPRDVRPEGGTLACFLSGDTVHEVLPARRHRASLTAWFRTRG